MHYAQREAVSWGLSRGVEHPTRDEASLIFRVVAYKEPCI